ncbi:MAG: S-layer homology domain-containing protein [Oscillospiraceae bacterium]|nr:S-layer homology domain-containing protein [Oscillospiraceae bacterium]
MKKRGWCIVLALSLLFSASAPVTAAPGTNDDPVVTRSYIEEIYLPSLMLKADAAINKQLNSLFAEILALLNGTALSVNEAALMRKIISRIEWKASSPQMVELKAGSRLTLKQGASVHLVSGSASHESGTLVDVTTGKDVASKAGLTVNHKVIGISGEADVKITTNAAVLVAGSVRFTPPYAAMYKDLCDALMTMRIINTYELERNTTRMEMFIIFVTVLGVKEAAYSHHTNHPFSDVAWGHEYVAYLYENGHTAGTGGGRFSPNDPGSVQQLCFIMLKALGYQDRVDIAYETAEADAVRLGLFSQREIDILTAEEFTRDAMMYMTYYSLFAHYKNSSERVIDRLIASGLVSAENAAKAYDSVKRERF